MICFLDLDGVLADFNGGVCKLFGISKQELYAKWPPGVWEVIQALGCKSSNELWSKIDACEDFWEKLEPIEGYTDIIKWCEEKFGGVVIATSPPHNPQGAAGKVKWIRDHLPGYRRKYAITPCKEELAHSEAVLLDDWDENIKKFRLNGGHAILVPRRWNSLHMVSAPPFLSVLDTAWFNITAQSNLGKRS